MRLAITGATGFLGGAVVRSGLRAGWSVSATGRDKIAGAVLSGYGAAFHPCEIGDVAGLRRVFAGCDAVVHCAALSSPWGSAEAFEAANVAGTHVVIAAAKGAEVPRIVHVSSSSVYFRFQDQLAVREDMVLPPPVNLYAASKGRAESVVRESGLSAVILRPRGIIGPGDRALLPRLAASALRGPLPLMRGGEALVDVTPVETVAAAVLAALDPRAPSGTYNVSNGEPIRVRALVEATMAAADIRVRWLPVPVPVALGGARLLEFVHRFLPSRPEPIVTAYSLGLMAYSQTLDIEAARTKLGLRASVPVAESVAAAGRAWKART